MSKEFCKRKNCCGNLYQLKLCLQLIHKETTKGPEQNPTPTPHQKGRRNRGRKVIKLKQNQNLRSEKEQKIKRSVREKGKIESPSKYMNNEQMRRMNCWTMTRNISENWEKRQKEEGKEAKNRKTNVFIFLVFVSNCTAWTWFFFFPELVGSLAEKLQPTTNKHHASQRFFCC